MTGLKDKIQIFLIGLLLGILLGGSFFILKLDGYFKQLSFYKRAVESASAIAKKDSLAIVNKEQQLKKKSVNYPYSKSSKISDSIGLVKKTLEAPDSLFLDSAKAIAVSEDIVIKKDEL